MKILTKAKINLLLDVVCRLKNGYHKINSIMHEIPLADEVTVTAAEKGIEISCSEAFIPCNEKNTAYKAAAAFFAKTGINGGCRIDIEKNIPVGAGLAGGSTNAAGVLKLLNELYGTGLSQNELIEIGAEVGADVPFCIMGGAALASGIGEVLTPVKTLPDCCILLAKPSFSITTASVFKAFNIRNAGKYDVKKYIRFLQSANLPAIAGNMKNILETVAVRRYDVIEKMKDDMKENGALGSVMSGSGPTVFGIFDDERKLQNAAQRLNKYTDFIWWGRVGGECREERPY